ncbi:hypothetical protein CMMCAS04_04735 [Clavibacter michiganensis subsp. michiganensis]|nr:hypothetical protein CMMCAS04_04735 [Clavibacter michiganensis subsp. michiganensis]
MLDEATRSDIGRAEGHSLVILTSLALCGLDWRAAGELIAATPELRECTPHVAATPELRECTPHVAAAPATAARTEAAS